MNWHSVIALGRCRLSLLQKCVWRWVIEKKWKSYRQSPDAIRLMPNPLNYYTWFIFNFIEFVLPGQSFAPPIDCAFSFFNSFISRSRSARYHAERTSSVLMYFWFAFHYLYRFRAPAFVLHARNAVQALAVELRKHALIPQAFQIARKKRKNIYFAVTNI